jgi:hypothetical protein
MTREMIPAKYAGVGILDMPSQKRVCVFLRSARRKEHSKAERAWGKGKSKKALVWLLYSAAWLPAQAQMPTINPNGLVNAATGRSASSIPVTARGTIVSIYGNNLASVTLRANGFPLPKDLGGVQVVFGGLPAALLYVSPSSPSLKPRF